MSAKEGSSGSILKKKSPGCTAPTMRTPNMEGPNRCHRPPRHAVGWKYHVFLRLPVSLRFQGCSTRQSLKSIHGERAHLHLYARISLMHFPSHLRLTMTAGPRACECSHDSVRGLTLAGHWWHERSKKNIVSLLVFLPLTPLTACVTNVQPRWSLSGRFKVRTRVHC